MAKLRHLAGYCALFFVILTCALLAQQFPRKKRYTELKGGSRNETVGLPQLAAQRALRSIQLHTFADERNPMHQQHADQQGKTREYGRSLVSTYLHQTEADTKKYLTFGTSISWGSGLDDRHDAYPYLLSPDTKNLAIRSTGPIYPSLCTESLVADEEIYDVIVMEYDYQKKGLVTLARRLRERFPDAIIIFLRLWSPLMVMTSQGENVREWADRNHRGALHSAQFEELFSNSNDQWTWVTKLPLWEKNANAEEEAVREVNGYVINLPRPDYPKDFVQNSSWFSSDWRHLSKEGHELVAGKIHNLVSSIGAATTKRLGTWGEGDSCQNWFESGDCSLDYSDNVEMELFQPAQKKYALRFPREGGMLTVTNPTSRPLELFLTYMVTGPAPGKYPKARVTVQHNPITVELDPVAPEVFGFRVHVSVTRSVGMVQPGHSVVEIHPLEENELPFRLIGTTLSGAHGDVAHTHFRGDIFVSRTSDKTR